MPINLSPPHHLTLQFSDWQTAMPLLFSALQDGAAPPERALSVRPQPLPPLSLLHSFYSHHIGLPLFSISSPPYRFHFILPFLFVFYLLFHPPPSPSSFSYSSSSSFLYISFLEPTLVILSSSLPQIRSAYQSVLTHLSSTLSPTQFLELIPDQGNLAFFLPFIRASLSYEHARNVRQTSGIR